MSPEASVAFLLERGLIDAGDVVAGDLRVDEIPGRNRNLRLESMTGRGYFLKQAPVDEGDRLLRLEGSIYARARDDARWASLRQWLPAFRLFDETHAVLVTDSSPAVKEVFEVDADGSDLDLPEIGLPLGLALAACHGAPIDEPGDLVPRLPWVLRIHRPHPRMLQEVWPAQVEVIRAIQADPGVGAALDALSGGWLTTSLIHGDLKFPNILVETAGTLEAGSLVVSPSTPDPRPPGIARVVLVDWETASVGDPAWDVGSVFQSYLWYGVHLVSIEDGTDAAAASRAFAARLPAIRRCVGTFWAAYRRAAGLAPDIEESFLGRATAFTGVRLLQTAYESAQGEERPGRLSTGSLQLALNVLRSPTLALEHLLGVLRLAQGR